MTEKPMKKLYLEDFNDDEIIYAFNHFLDDQKIIMKRVDPNGREEEIVHENKERAEVAIQLDPKDDLGPLIRIPATFVPVRLNDYATTPDLKKCQSLRTFVTKGILRLAKHEDIKHMFSDPQVIEEYNRLSQVLGSPMTVAEIPREDSVVEAMADRSDELALDPVLADIMSRSDVPDDERLQLLQKRLGEIESFSEVDLDFITVSCKDNSPISRWVKGLRNE